MKFKEELKNMQTKCLITEQLNGKLKDELMTSRNDAGRIQNLLKKQELEIVTLKNASDAQKEIKARYDRDM